MGYDLQYVVERKTDDGRWFGVASIEYWDVFYGEPTWLHFPGAWLLAGRDYDLYGLLLGFRGKCADTGPVASLGLPSDASDNALCEYSRLEGDRGAYWGHVDGKVLAKLAAAAQSEGASSEDVEARLDAWAQAAIQMLESGKCDEVMPIQARVKVNRDGDEERTLWDIGHEGRFESERLSKRLLDWREHPEAWRLILYIIA